MARRTRDNYDRIVHSRRVRSSAIAPSDDPMRVACSWTWRRLFARLVLKVDISKLSESLGLRKVRHRPKREFGYTGRCTRNGATYWRPEMAGSHPDCELRCSCGSSVTPGRPEDTQRAIEPLSLPPVGRLARWTFFNELRFAENPNLARLLNGKVP